MNINERLKISRAAVEAHEMFYLEALHQKRIRYFNLFIESGVMVGSAILGVRSYQLNKVESSLMYAWTGNPYVLRATSPGAVLMAFIFCITGVLAYWDMKGAVAARQMMTAQQSILAQLHDDIKEMEKSV